MAFIPPDARWYWADIILEHLIEDDPRNVIHINMTLIEAHSPQQAYEKAMALGRSQATSYKNTAGKKVRVKFRGLRQLDVIHDGLLDGEEITWSRRIRQTPAQVRKLRTKKRQLNVFRPIEPEFNQPNLLSGDIVDQLVEQGFEREFLDALASVRTKRPRPPRKRSR
jgi:hypothetical protein